MKLGQVCQTRVVTTAPDEPLSNAVDEMRRAHVGALVVVETRLGRVWPVGIITDRDAAVAMTTRGPVDALSVRDAMRQPVIVARQSDDFFDGLAKMRRSGVRRLPVIAADGSLFGIITLDDVIDVLSAKLREATAVMVRGRQAEARHHSNRGSNSTASRTNLAYEKGASSSSHDASTSNGTNTP
jgi:CBS domain-containing protein